MEPLLGLPIPHARAYGEDPASAHGCGRSPDACAHGCEVAAIGSRACGGASPLHASARVYGSRPHACANARAVP